MKVLFLFIYFATFCCVDNISQGYFGDAKGPSSDAKSVSHDQTLNLPTKYSRDARYTLRQLNGDSGISRNIKGDGNLLYGIHRYLGQKWKKSSGDELDVSREARSWGRRGSRRSRSRSRNSGRRSRYGRWRSRRLGNSWRRNRYGRWRNRHVRKSWRRSRYLGMKSRRIIKGLAKLNKYIKPVVKIASKLKKYRKPVLKIASKLSKGKYVGAGLIAAETAAKEYMRLRPNSKLSKALRKAVVYGDRNKYLKLAYNLAKKILRRRDLDHVVTQRRSLHVTKGQNHTPSEGVKKTSSQSLGDDEGSRESYPNNAKAGYAFEKNEVTTSPASA